MWLWLVDVVAEKHQQAVLTLQSLLPWPLWAKQNTSEAIELAATAAGAQTMHKSKSQHKLKSKQGTKRGCGASGNKVIKT